MYILLPEDEPSVSKNIEDIKLKIKTLILEMRISLAYIL
jgi:hypothetical protein